MIRVLFDPEIFALQSRGGIPRVFMGLYKEFETNPSHGIKAIIPSGPWFPYCSLDNGPTRPPTPERVKRLAQSQIALLRELPNVDIVQETYYTRWRYRGRKPTVVTIHDAIFEDTRGSVSRFSAFIDKGARVDRASHVVFVSKTSETEFRSHHKRAMRSSVIYSGVALSPSGTFENEMPDRWGLKDFFLYVGTRRGHKDYKTLIKGAEILAESGIQVSLLCVGGGPLRPDETSQNPDVHITQEDLSDHQLARAYASALATVVTSTAEGFGYPLLESFRCGTEVICSDITIFRETANDLPHYFPPRNAHALAQLLNSFVKQERPLANDVHRKSELIEFGTRFTWSKMASEYAAIYRSALGT